MTSMSVWCFVSNWAGCHASFFSEHVSIFIFFSSSTSQALQAWAWFYISGHYLAHMLL